MGDSLCILPRLNCGSNCLRWIVEFTVASSLFMAWNLFSFTNNWEFSMFTIQWIIVVLVFYVLSWLWLISTNQFVLCLDLNIVSFISLFLLVYFFTVLCFFVYGLLLLLLWIPISWEKILFLLLNHYLITFFSLIYCMLNDWFSSHLS